jgi:hypothetical protein
MASQHSTRLSQEARVGVMQFWLRGVVREASALIAREAKRIRTKLLKFLDSRIEKQVRTGERRRLGNVSRHQWLRGERGRHIGS